MRVYITGSCKKASENEKTLFAKVCRDIGNELLKTNHSIVVGAIGEETADYHVTEAMRQGKRGDGLNTKI